MPTNTTGLSERTRSHIDTTQTISGKQEEEEAEEVEDEEEEAGHLYEHNYQEDNKLSRHFKKITGHNVLNPLDIQPLQQLVKLDHYLWKHKYE